MSGIVDKLRSFDISHIPPAMMAPLEGLQSHFRGLLEDDVVDLESAYHGVAIACMLLDEDEKALFKTADLLGLSNTEMLLLLITVSRKT